MASRAVARNCCRSNRNRVRTPPASTAASGFALNYFEAGHDVDVWWWPDLVMDGGIAAFIGICIGWWLRRRLNLAK